MTPGSIEEAGQYISTFKQFEHKPPDLIKERVDKDYDALLRTALTSINKVNKTDVETLRSSLGVCHIYHHPYFQPYLANALELRRHSSRIS